MLDIVKELARRDYCYVELECINESFRYFQNHGFKSSCRCKLTYTPKEPFQKLSMDNKLIKPVFVDYSIIKEERKKKAEQEIRKDCESFQKFLKSPLYSYLNNL